MQLRTIRNFRYTGDLWAIIDVWAQENRFVLQEPTDETRIYYRSPLLLAPIMVEIDRNGTDITLMAWVRNLKPNAAFYIAHLFPNEVELRSGGFWASAPRAYGRKWVNKLLLQLEQPPIQ